MLPFGHLMNCSTPAVGVDVGVRLKRLLSAASADEREVVFVGSRSVTLWRIVRIDGAHARPCEGVL